MKPRAAGVLLHPTSLPSAFGVGDLGPGAYAFLDWLEAAGQSVWQVLPLGPPAGFQSPYWCLSAFAGNPLLISPEELEKEGLLQRDELEGVPTSTPHRWDPPRVEPFRRRMLRRAWSRFREGGASDLLESFEAFCSAPEQAGWLEDYVLFVTLREELREGWWSWPRELAQRDAAALERARNDRRDELAFHRFVQWLFHRQWSRLRGAAAQKGLRLMGDLPIYVAHDCADVWAHPSLFALDEHGHRKVVAGVPPDYFSADGQLWGNPLYRWEEMEASGFSWWIHRVAANLRLTDLIRLDHFRAFAAYYEVAASAPNAREGRWVEGPGRALFDALRGALGELPFVAEDLGVITEDVVELRESLGLPGMRVLQFGLGEADGYHSPHRYTADDVVYTGTHDNDTTVGWFASLPRPERHRVLRYAGGRPREIHRSLIRLAYTSVAHLAIVPMQDVLGLGKEARMNTPGESLGNWIWRLDEGDLSPCAARRMRRMAELTGRLPARRALPLEAGEEADSPAGAVGTASA